MLYTLIAEEIANQELRSKLGATPANSVNSTINRSIAEKGDESPFVKVDRGKYFLRKMAESKDDEAINRKSVSDENETGAIGALGMFWRSSEVNWKRMPRLLGQQQAGADTIDFCDQVGIYLLHDRERVIYIGRVIDRPMGQRLYEHTKDRLNGRWDRFSWFGIRTVSEDGKLLPVVETVSSNADLITTLEAVLIEALEPPQNRRRGDQLATIEYLQAADPDRGAAKKSLIASLLTEL